MHVQPVETGKLRRRTTQQRQQQQEEATALRMAVQASDPKALGGSNRLPDRDRSERKHFLFYQDEGGMRATGEDNEALDQLYYLGIIDILTPYTLYKRFEHFGKTFKYDGDVISAVPPVQYGQRFLRFLCSSVRGADVSQRPKVRLCGHFGLARLTAAGPDDRVTRRHSVDTRLYAVPPFPCLRWLLCPLEICNLAWPTFVPAHRGKLSSLTALVQGKG
jgi:hypothetical protein